MSDYKIKTLEYYDKNAEKFVEGTLESDVSNLYGHFEKYFQKGQSILDLGCGAGRDTKYFLGNGFDGMDVDGSQVLCSYASEFTGIEVRCLLFENLDYIKRFDGVWACASLLHVSKDQIKDVLTKVNRALKSEGILFTCFKYGDFEYEKDGRFFSNYTEKTIKSIINEESGFEIIEIFVTGDVREDRSDQRWVNVIARKFKTCERRL